MLEETLEKLIAWHLNEVKWLRDALVGTEKRERLRYRTRLLNHNRTLDALRKLKRLQANRGESQ